MKYYNLITSHFSGPRKQRGPAEFHVYTQHIKEISMYDQLIAAGRLLIAAISIPLIQPNAKRSIGKNFSGLHNDLTQLYENGTEILNIFEKYNNGDNVDIDEIKSLLVQQHFLIPKLLLFFDKKEIKTLISIKAPEIKPIRFLLFEKGFRVKFYLDEIDENEKRRSDGERIDWLRGRARVDLPEQDAIDRSRVELEKIKELTEELRQFIIINFQINEII